MEKFKKYLGMILSSLLFLLYASLVTIAPKYIFDGFKDNYIVTFIAYLIIFGTIGSLIYGIASHYKYLSKMMKPFPKISLFNLNLFQEDEQNHTHKQADLLLKKGNKVVLVSSFVFVLELLFPFAIAYVSMSPFASIATVINFRYFMNLISFEGTKIEAMKEKEIPHLTKLIYELKQELNIKRKIYFKQGIGIECSLLIENSKIYIGLGPDLLKILNSQELKALIYSLLLNFENDDFEINLKLTRYSNLVSFFNFKAVIPMNIMNGDLFLGNATFYLQLASENNHTVYFVKIKDTPYLEDFLKAKYKKTRFNLLNLYLDPHDYLKIDPKNYFETHLNMKLDKIKELPFINDMAKVALHSSREMELTYREVKDILKVDDIEINEELNDEFNEDYLSFCEKSPLNKEENVINKYKRYISSISATEEFEKEFIKNENPTLDDKIQYALGLFIKREYKACLDMALKLEEENPNDDSLCLLLGNIYVKACNSLKCEDYLRRNFYKHEIILTATNLLEDFYCHNGMKEKLQEFESTIVEGQKLMIQDRLEKQNFYVGEEEIQSINQNSDINSQIIEKIKSLKEVKHLIMFDKYTDASYHLYVLIGLDNLKDKRVIDEVKEYLLSRDDVNVILKVFTKKDKKVLDKFKDHIIY